MEELLKKKSGYVFEDLVKVMAILRGEGGCPWDREQTHESIKMNTIEEAYELVEAINNSDTENIKEELGDLLLHVVFHSKIAEEDGKFNVDDVANDIVVKLIRRHPHIFGNVAADTSDKVLKNWEEIKKAEKKHTLTSETMDSIAKALPSLMRANKVQKKAAHVGFDFENWKDAMEKVYEELKEFEEAAESKDEAHIQEEFGDILFAIVNISRFFKVNPENCLTNSVEKFINRFKGVEEMAQNQGKSLEELSLIEMDKLWDAVKNSR